jgi:hypothetical protein
MGWLFDGERSSARAFAPDLRKDPLIRKIDSCSGLGAARPRDRSRSGFVLSGCDRRGADRVRLGRPRARVPASTTRRGASTRSATCTAAPVRDRGREPQQLGVALVSLGEGWHPLSTTPFPTSAKHGLVAGPARPSYRLIQAVF